MMNIAKNQKLIYLTLWKYSPPPPNQMASRHIPLFFQTSKVNLLYSSYFMHAYLFLTPSG